MSRMRKILIGILSVCMVIVFVAPSVFADYECGYPDGGAYYIYDQYSGIDGVKIEVYGDNTNTPIAKTYETDDGIEIDTSNKVGVESSATAQGGSATSKAIINGDVKVNANANGDYNGNVDGVIANANISPSGNATAIVEVNGSVNVGSSEYEGNTIGIETVAFGRESTRGGSNRGTTSTASSSVEVQNDVNVSSVSSATGVDMQAVYDSPNNKETAVNVSVGGDVNVSAGNEAYGISFFPEKSNEGNIKAEIAVGGDVNAKITGSTETEIASSGPLAAGIYIQKFNDADYYEPYGPIQNLNMTADINGSIIADGGENGTSIGVLLDVSDSTVNLSAKNISATSTGEYGYGEGAVICTDDGSTVTIHVLNDLSGTTQGLYIGSNDESDVIDVVVEGTLSGGESSVYISHLEDADSLKLTVWKADLYKTDDGEEHVINGNDLNPEYLQYLEQNIQYIIKVEQPNEGGTLSLSQEDGNPLDKSHDYFVSQQGKMVLLKVNVEEGFKITGAYNGSEEKEELKLYQDKDNVYYVVVPKGGGVYLTATFEKIPEPEEEKEEKKEEEKQPEKTQPKQQEQEEKAEVPAAKPEESARSAQLIALAPQAVVPAQQADVLLTKEDNDKKIKITFYDNSTYSVLLEDGITSSGRFMIKNGEIVLSVPSGDPASIDKDGHLEYIPFSHVSGTESLESMGIQSIGNSYDFDFSSDELTTLLSGIKASPSLTVQDNSGKLNVTFYSNGIYEAAYQDAEDHTSLYYGTFRLEKQEATGIEEIILRDVNGNDMPVQEDGTLKMTLDQSEFSCQLTNQNIESLKTIAAQN